MAVISYSVVQKPLEQRIIDAACIYWDVDIEYFRSKRPNDTVVRRKGIIYYLIKHNTTHSLAYIASLFGHVDHAHVIKAVNSIDSEKDVYREINADMNRIMHLASQIDATVIRTNITLVNNQLIAS